MKRIFAILMVAVFMVSVMIVMTAPAFAACAACEPPFKNAAGKKPPGHTPNPNPGK